MKSDWKDDIFSGNRKYHMVNNADGTISLEDRTTYTQTGDQFGAGELNTIAKEVNAISGVTTVNLLASEWSNASPYTQTVNVSGMLATSNPVISIAPPSTESADAYKASVRAFSMLDKAVTANGSMTFYCYRQKPTSNFNVFVKGI